jgi:transcriptional regulator with XRE-family HTH domain
MLTSSIYSVDRSNELLANVDESYTPVKLKRYVSYPLMETASFGQRLRIAFGNAKLAEIARKLGVSEAAVKNYVGGRVPDSDKLIKISTLTNCNLHWLLTGEGPKFLNESEVFDLEYEIERADDWMDVMKRWYAFEGAEMPDTQGASFMGGWRSFDIKHKASALRDFKRFLDMIKDE